MRTTPVVDIRQQPRRLRVELLRALVDARLEVNDLGDAITVEIDVIAEQLPGALDDIEGAVDTR